MPRRILPVPSSLPLASLLALCHPPAPLGAWLEAAQPWVRPAAPGLGGRRLIVFSPDLASLLALTPRVAVWNGSQMRTIVPRVLAGHGDLALPQPVDCVAEVPLG